MIAFVAPTDGDLPGEGLRNGGCSVITHSTRTRRYQCNVQGFKCHGGCGRRAAWCVKIGELSDGPFAPLWVCRLAYLGLGTADCASRGAHFDNNSRHHKQVTAMPETQPSTLRNPSINDEVMRIPVPTRSLLSQTTASAASTPVPSIPRAHCSPGSPSQLAVARVVVFAKVSRAACTPAPGPHSCIEVPLPLHDAESLGEPDHACFGCCVGDCFVPRDST